MPGKYLTDFEKGRIIALHDFCVSCNNIAQELSRGRHTIEKIVFSNQISEMARTGKPTPPKPESRRPKCTSEHLDRLIRRAITENPRLFAKGIKANFMEELKDVAIRTIQHRLQKDLGSQSRHAAGKVLLTEAMKK